MGWFLGGGQSQTEKRKHQVNIQEGLRKLDGKEEGEMFVLASKGTQVPKAETKEYRIEEKNHLKKLLWPTVEKAIPVGVLTETPTKGEDGNGKHERSLSLFRHKAIVLSYNERKSRGGSWGRIEGGNGGKKEKEGNIPRHRQNLGGGQSQKGGGVEGIERGKGKKGRTGGNNREKSYSSG